MVRQDEVRVCPDCVSYYNRVCFYLHIPLPRESEEFADICEHFRRRREGAPIQPLTRRDRRGGVD